MRRDQFRLLTSQSGTPTLENVWRPTQRKCFRQLCPAAAILGCVPGTCSGVTWNRPCAISGQQASLGLGESVNWTTGMHPTLNRFRWTATFTNPGGAAGTVYAYPLRCEMLSDYMGVEGESTNEWPGSQVPDGSGGLSGIPILWNAVPTKGNPILCREAASNNMTLSYTATSSSLNTGIKYIAKVTNGTAGSPVAKTNVSDDLETTPAKLISYDVVFGATYTAGQTDTRFMRIDSITNFLDSFGYFNVSSTSNKGFRVLAGGAPSGTPYDGFQFTFAGGSYRPTGTVANVLTMDKTNSVLTGCGAASTASNFTLYMNREMPYVSMYNGSAWLVYAPEPNGAFIQSCVSTETGDLYEHTIGSWDCITSTVFLPYYGVEINSPPRTWPFTAPSSITVERIALTS